MIYQFIDENKYIFGLRWLFRHFHMAPNAYYNYLKDNKDAYRKKKQNIFEEIKSIYYNNHRILGHLGIKIFLAQRCKKIKHGVLILPISGYPMGKCGTAARL